MTSASGWIYDLAGNVIRGQNASGVWQQFKYDAAGRLVEIWNDANTVLIEAYTYGASRERLITTTSAGRTYYVWGGQSVIGEYTETGSGTIPTFTKSYVYAGSRLLAVSYSSGLLEFHHPDRIGTQLVTWGGTIGTVRQSTYPFGTLESGPQSNQVFTSYDRSAGTGLDYAVNRTYSSGQSRFTQVDPIGMAAAALGDPQSNNLYAYTQNMPTDFVDPSGLNAAAMGYWNPMGVAYYVDGFLTTASHAWAILNGGSGYIDFHDVGGLTVVDTGVRFRDPEVFVRISQTILVSVLNAVSNTDNTAKTDISSNFGFGSDPRRQRLLRCLAGVWLKSLPRSVESTISLEAGKAIIGGHILLSVSLGGHGAQSLNPFKAIGGMKDAGITGAGGIWAGSKFLSHGAPMMAANIVDTARGYRNCF